MEYLSDKVSRVKTVTVVVRQVKVPKSVETGKEEK